MALPIGGNAEPSEYRVYERTPFMSHKKVTEVAAPDLADNNGFRLSNLHRAERVAALGVPVAVPSPDVPTEEEIHHGTMRPLANGASDHTFLRTPRFSVWRRLTTSGVQAFSLSIWEVSAKVLTLFFDVKYRRFFSSKS
jgi:hypothetical protein